ncbi:MAG: sigma 54-interacting transcriptional regulator [Acidobacteriota bacterium]
MAIRALRFTHGSEATQTEIDAQRIKALAKPAAYIVASRNLSSLRKLEDAVMDRGSKLRAKELSKLLLGHAKIALINGSYTSARQVGRSARTLLENAARRGDRNAYIIGADEKIFEELWEKAGKTESQRRRSKSFSKPAPPRDEISPRSLLEMIEQRDVPEDLLRSYVGQSPEAQLVRQLILRAAAHDEPVLILGDTGTGKEVIARSIHKYSARASEKFIPVNCGAIPRELLESELFGHKKFTFTDAKFDKKGLWEVAGNGTLFLDEIGDLSPDHQVKILRALDEKKIRPVGESKEVKVNARVVAATNRDLFSMVQSGQFREDLYYRLRAFMIRSPALRNHSEDIPLLAKHFWARITADPASEPPEDILDYLKSYRWPGNARELKAVLMSVYTLFGDYGLTIEHLHAVFQLQGQSQTERASTAEQEIKLHRVECLRHLKRVDEVVRASKVAPRPVLGEKNPDEADVRLAQLALSDRLREIEVLCLRPLLFGSEVAFSVVYRLKGKLSYFSSLLQKDVRIALSYWKDEVADEFKLALSAVFREAERLTASM